MRFLSVAARACIVALLLVSRPAAAQPTQPIYLQYDGYVHNADGTYTLSFGYFNMSNVDVTVPAGDGNSFTPGPADRNQAAKFLKGRHRFASQHGDGQGLRREAAVDGEVRRQDEQAAGRYEIGLSASDGEKSARATVGVTISPAP
jgi:hypothetical protein